MKLRALAASLLFVAITAHAAPESEFIAAGRAAMERSDIDRAVEQYEKAIAAAPKSAEAHFLLGGAYARKAMGASMFSAISLGSKMKDAYTRSIELDPSFLPARFSMVEFYLQAPAIAGGGKDKALAEAAEIRKRDSLEGARAFSRIHGYYEEHDLAVKEMTDAVRAHPKSARAQYFLGNAYMGRKDWKLALEAYEAALVLDAAFMPAYYRIGNHAARAETNYVRGEEALRKYLAYKPNDTEPGPAGAWFYLGLIQEKQGRKPDARESYLKAQKLLPQMKDLPEALKRVS
jgi:tetratricopeptide (TPR) repeat protein